MESKRNASSSGASCDGVSLCLYLAMIAISASPSLCIKLYGYDLLQYRINKDIFSGSQYKL